MVSKKAGHRDGAGLGFVWFSGAGAAGERLLPLLVPDLSVVFVGPLSGATVALVSSPLEGPGTLAACARREVQLCW